MRRSEARAKGGRPVEHIELNEWSARVTLMLIRDVDILYNSDVIMLVIMMWTRREGKCWSFQEAMRVVLVSMVGGVVVLWCCGVMCADAVLSNIDVCLLLRLPDLVYSSTSSRMSEHSMQSLSSTMPRATREVKKALRAVG